MIPLIKQKILTEDDKFAVCSNVEIILGYHRELLSQLRANPEKCGKIISEFAAFLRVYKQFATESKRSGDRVAALQKNKRFMEFMVQQKANLSSLLILPIQRIPRYKLLLEAILKSNDASLTAELRDQYKQVCKPLTSRVKSNIINPGRNQNLSSCHGAERGSFLIFVVAISDELDSTI
jgi:hypothetical protein